MAQTAKFVYTSNQTVTITLGFLFNTRLALSSTIDNSTNRFLSMDVQIQVKSGASVSTGGLYRNPGVGIYLERTTEGSTTGRFDSVRGPSTAADYFASVTNVNNPELIGVVFTPAGATTYRASFRVENLPAYFKILAYNGTGNILDFTNSNHYIKYVGKYLQLV